MTHHHSCAFYHERGPFDPPRTCSCSGLASMSVDRLTREDVTTEHAELMAFQGSGTSRETSDALTRVLALIERLTIGSRDPLFEYLQAAGRGRCKWCGAVWDVIGPNGELQSTQMGKLHPRNNCIVPDLEVLCETKETT